MSKYNPPPASLRPGSSVWVYLRDSGGDAQEQSVAQQKAEAKNFCAAHRLTLSIIFADEAKSAGSDAGRAEFIRMIDLSEHARQRPAGILFWNFSRFARNYDDAQFYKATLRKRGLVLHNITGPTFDNTLEGRVMESVMDYANAEKLRQTSRDVKRALEANTRQGFSAGGFPPRGYITEKVTLGFKRNGQPREVSKWVIDPELSDVVKLAWRMRSEGRSLSHIMRATGDRLYKSKNSWSSFFSNKTYLGVGKCGDLEIPDHHPALVDLETWNKVQRRMNASSSSLITRARVKDRSTLLSGLAFCLACGSTMVFEHSGRTKWASYLCGRKRRESYKACVSRRVGAKGADAFVMEAVLNKILTPAYLHALLEQTRAQFADPGSFEAEADRLKKALADCRRKLKNLRAQIETFGPSQTAATGLQAREGEEEQLILELKNLEAKHDAAQLEISPEALALALDVWRGKISAAREARDVIALRNHLQEFVTRIELGYGTARIHYTYPIADLTSNGNDDLWGHLLIPCQVITVEWSTR